ncbi:hypothetical protein D3C80_1365460 [compost metagenome]
MPVRDRLRSAPDARLQRVIRREALQPPDRDRLAFFAADAFALALVLLRADAAADRRQAVLGRDGPIRLLEFTGCHRMDELGDRDADGTAVHARLMLALQAALRFFHRLLRGILKRDFFKIARPHHRGLLRHPPSLCSY